jgi:hypothetical protein
VQLEPRDAGGNEVRAQLGGVALDRDEAALLLAM